jgi:hypothetical protein
VPNLNEKLRSILDYWGTGGVVFDSLVIIKIIIAFTRQELLKGYLANN